MTYRLTFAEKASPFPYTVYVLASLLSTAPSSAVSLDLVEGPTATPSADKKAAKVPFTFTANNESYANSATVLRQLARITPDLKLYGNNADASALVDYWLDFVNDNLATTDFRKIVGSLEELNYHLTCRSFFVGYRVTLADIAIWGALRANPAFNKNVKDGRDVGAHLVRWFNYISSLDFVRDALLALTTSINSRKVKKDIGNYGINLEGASKGNVVTRFPPEPSGYLHIGHAKAALLNQYFAQTYEGKLIVRFDDTNPSKEKVEFEDSIMEDLALLGIKGDVVTHTSDYFEKLWNVCKDTVQKGLAYVDDTPKETMADERFNGRPSKCRDLSVEENLKRLDEMLKGTELGQKCCVRAKMSIDDPNKCLRDPVIYRCNVTPHHRTGSKWKVYPTYDFACPLVDSWEGVTHALRTNEYRDRNPQYQWFLDNLGLRKVHIWDYSRMNFKYTLLSKRKLQWFVDQGIVAGWDDPRFPTVRGIRRRGMTVSALKDYIISQGPSTNAVNLEWDKLWALNRKVIDPVAPRHVRVLKDDCVKLRLTGGPEKPFTKDIPKHKKNAAAGVKLTVFASEIYLDQSDAATLAVNEEITLMDWGNAIVTRVDENGLAAEMRLHLEGDFKTTQKKIHWLAAVPDLVECEIIEYDYLINKEKLEDGDDVKNFVTKVSEFKKNALADKNVKDCKKGDIIQFERFGYYIVDVPYVDASSKAVLISVPDGHAASTVSKADSGNGGGSKKEKKEKK